MRDLKETLSHAQEGYLTFHVGEVTNCFTEGGQNVFLDTKVINVRSNISTFEHCTNFSHMGKFENALVMSEMPTVVFNLSCTIFASNHYKE